MNTIQTALEHVIARLRAANLGAPIVEGLAGEGAPSPLILVQVYGDPTVTLYNGENVSHGMAQISVRAVGTDQSLESLRDLATGISDALHATSGSYRAGAVISCARRREMYLAQNESGKPVRYVGHLFELMVS